MVKYEALLEQTPDPEVTGHRLERLMQDGTIEHHIEKLPAEDMPHFLNLISISNFIYHYLCRHPDTLSLFYGPQTMNREELESIEDLDELRQFKYRELIKISWMDLCQCFSYQVVLDRLSYLAECTINRAMQLITRDMQGKAVSGDGYPFTMFGMGKLGAGELNFSSDVDLIFVSRNETDGVDYHDYLEMIVEQIRRFSHDLEERTEDGFLYRVDLKLRPWGRNGPLVMSIDETELYYEGSNEAWERFAWLRARIIGGDKALGEDLLQRLEPFIYLRSISSDDLARFVKIKHDMAAQRKRRGTWNVKLGDGGIRDIEFFVQMLQIVNASSHAELKTTNTIQLIDLLTGLGFFSKEEGREITESYVFLRRLENRLQMVDELQTHQLSDDPAQRCKIASSLGFGPGRDDATLESFNRQLQAHRNIAGACFERILPKEQ